MLTEESRRPVVHSLNSSALSSPTNPYLALLYHSMAIWVLSHTTITIQFFPGNILTHNVTSIRIFARNWTPTWHQRYFFDKIDTTIQYQWYFESKLSPKIEHLYQFCVIILRTYTNTDELTFVRLCSTSDKPKSLK